MLNKKAKGTARALQNLSRLLAKQHKTVFAALVVAVALAMTGVVMPALVKAETADSARAETQEWEILALINIERRAAGLQPLRMQTNIRDYGRVHAKDMRIQVRIWHDMPAYAAWLPAGWRSYGENVAYNSTPARVHQSLMDSPGHKANILSSKFNYVGLGVAHSANGTLYLSQNFLEHPGQVSVVTPPGTSPTLPVVPLPPATPPATPPRMPLAAPLPQPATVAGDASADGKVNALDLSIVGTRDGQNYAPADFNRDGTVGAADLSIVLSRWTW
ncbi:MAG TPA: CAP domain-containing protein [Candidatus Saccharimonadales bacterium]|nr:CAP domain-containing protein [Candidatus Saccharimonadales bacterium]